MENENNDLRNKNEVLRQKLAEVVARGGEVDGGGEPGGGTVERPSRAMEGSGRTARYHPYEKRPPRATGSAPVVSAPNSPATSLYASTPSGTPELASPAALSQEEADKDGYDLLRAALFNFFASTSSVPNSPATISYASTRSGTPVPASPGALLQEDDEENGYDLLLAAKTGQKDDVEMLLSEGAPLSFTDHIGSTALHVAARNGHTNVVSVLVSAGATLDAQDKAGDTPLHLAAIKGCTESMSVLINAGATIDARDHLRFSPLHMAAIHGQWQCLKMLLNAGADVNVVNIRGDTPLHEAAYHKREQCAHLLISCGADTTIRNHEGKTANVEAYTSAK